MDSKVTKIQGSWIRFLKTSMTESSLNVLACMLNAVEDGFFFVVVVFLWKSSKGCLKCLMSKHRCNDPRCQSEHQFY